MSRDKHIKNINSKESIKDKMKAIKRAKKRGNEAKAQRLSDELIVFLGWD